MNTKLAIAIVCLAIAGYILGFFCEEAFGMGFTVDDRSLLHVGASAGIAAGVDAALIAGTELDTRERMAWTLGSCLAVGLGKELLIDAEPDAGDAVFDLLGCGLGWVGTEQVWLHASRDTLSIGGRW